MPVMIDLGIDQKERFLRKSNKIMLGIERRIHTEAEYSSLALYDHQYHCDRFLPWVNVKTRLALPLDQ